MGCGACAENMHVVPSQHETPSGHHACCSLLPSSLHSNSEADCAAVLHQYFLALFGLNIGELWDLKALGETCKRLGRYEFLFTSIPLNVPGGIGSPPNALAIF